MSDIKNSYLRLLNSSNELARFSFSGSDFKDEKAIMIGEIYFKDIWRFSAVGQGFNGGLSTLLKYFGGEETPTEPQQATICPKVDISKAVLLEKKLEKEAPHLISLAEKLSISLEKKQLQDTVAKVVIVMDASGSMYLSYQNGCFQSVLDRIALLAARLDDDGNLETWFYAEKCARLPDITIQNVSNYLKEQEVYPAYAGFSISSIFNFRVINNWTAKVGGNWNNELPIMQNIVSVYKSSNLPVLVIFITDGDIKKTDEIKKILIKASDYPIFWQFVGLRGKNYGVLDELDNMEGRTIDNANFFQADDLAVISDEELYDRLLNEFPIWLKEAKKKGLF
jgi:hypothetical protein